MAMPIKMLRLSKGMSTGTVLEWLKSPGDPIRKGEPLLNVLSEKVDVQVEAPTSGVLLDVQVAEGEEVPVGTVLGWIRQLDERPKTSEQGETASGTGPRELSARVDASPEQRTRSTRDTGPPSTTVKASPVARRMAAEHGISLAALRGSGPGGVITKSDVERAIEAQLGVPVSAEGPDVTAEPEDVERMPLQGIRKVMAERMALSKHTAADVTTIVDVDMGALRALKEHVPVTYTSAVVKAAALGLRERRLLNASLDGEEVLLHKCIHVGVAVDTPRGLIVVTVADADQKALRQVDEELRHLSQSSKEGRLRPDEMESPTFTVTNSGVFGTLVFTPIINPPQSAILGMGKVQETPVVRDGEVMARPVMYLCLTYDHRIIEGAEAAGFLQDVKGCLEDPVRMM